MALLTQPTTLSSSPVVLYNGSSPMEETKTQEKASIIFYKLKEIIANTSNKIIESYNQLSDKKKRVLLLSFALLWLAAQVSLLSFNDGFTLSNHFLIFAMNFTLFSIVPILRALKEKKKTKALVIALTLTLFLSAMKAFSIYCTNLYYLLSTVTNLFLLYYLYRNSSSFCKNFI